MLDKSDKKFNLEERTAAFGEDVIDLCKKIPKNTVTIVVISQTVRSGTSVGANYCEANGASSRKDFKNKIYICKKEAKETQYWLRILARATPEHKEECRRLWQEAKELAMIFATIAKNTS